MQVLSESIEYNTIVHWRINDASGLFLCKEVINMKLIEQVEELMNQVISALFNVEL